MLLDHRCIGLVENIGAQMIYQKTSIKARAVENTSASQSSDLELKPWKYLNMSCA